ncbi:hypothetical protein HWC99_gp62 [Flavobacterium phage vB_FspS_tant8-1]|uniref:Uncharacterized protein n=1 Tax=Flavobacterium phage vB_FspS_tant8-1 TaxID=2686278 RepID=A0A6B9LJ12_9CAUD|nr:hypothetical protein HWC99_gp62 [Flavobacterium phage vB_FspS_tant8-1]QHB40993.1 hypothetical protein tant81_gp062 [Flavobacterium phage vB_FspS_tant8-1]
MSKIFHKVFKCLFAKRHRSSGGVFLFYSIKK